MSIISRTFNWSSYVINNDGQVETGQKKWSWSCIIILLKGRHKHTTTAVNCLIHQENPFTLVLKWIGVTMVTKRPCIAIEIASTDTFPWVTLCSVDTFYLSQSSLVDLSHHKWTESELKLTDTSFPNVLGSVVWSAPLWLTLTRVHSQNTNI